MVDEVSDGFECPFSSSHVQANESAVPQQRTKICMTFPTRGGRAEFLCRFPASRTPPMSVDQPLWLPPWNIFRDEGKTMMYSRHQYPLPRWDRLR